MGGFTSNASSPPVFSCLGAELPLWKSLLKDQQQLRKITSQTMDLGELFLQIANFIRTLNPGHFQNYVLKFFFCVCVMVVLLWTLQTRVDWRMWFNGNMTFWQSCLENKGCIKRIMLCNTCTHPCFTVMPQVQACCCAPIYIWLYFA